MEELGGLLFDLELVLELCVVDWLLGYGVDFYVCDVCFDMLMFVLLLCGIDVVLVL